MGKDRDEIEEEVRTAFEMAQPGHVLVICRWNCKTTDGCPMCARVTIREGQTVQDVLQIATAHRA